MSGTKQFRETEQLAKKTLVLAKPQGLTIMQFSLTCTWGFSLTRHDHFYFYASVRFHLAYIDLYQPKHIPNTGSVLDILGDAMGVLLSPVMLLASHASRRVVGG